MPHSPLAPDALHPLLADALRTKGYDTLTEVQAAVANPGIAGRDMLVSSRTGSGKTVAYGLGMASDLLASSETGRALPPPSKPLALVIAPTRELALQVQRELRWLYEAAGTIIATCVGGMDQRAERRTLERGVHIVVGTPGRLVDHLTRGALALDGLKVVVLDEADEMLDLGFRDDLETLLAATPETRRTLLFSATLPRGIVALATRFQRNAARIEVAGDAAGHADIEHRAAFVKPHAVEHGVVNLLRESDALAALVFCNTRDAVRHLHATLIERGFAAVILSGELGQHDRNQALQALRDGRARVCIATDVAARGIDLPHLGLVIHADLPHDSEVLQHRSGRTGRAGRKGVSIMLVPPSRRAKALRLFAEGGIVPTWVALPTADAIRALDQDRLLADETPFADLSDTDREMGAALLERRSPAEIAAALAHVFRARLPEPEEIDPIQPDEQQRHRKDGGKPRGRDGVPTNAQAFRWFELSVGRRDNAEPKAILRMLTRSGGLDRQAVGAIRIQDDVTHVQVATDAAERFERKHAHPAPDDIRVRPIEAPAAGNHRPFSKRGDDRREPHPAAIRKDRKTPFKRDADRKTAAAPRNNGGTRPDGEWSASGRKGGKVPAPGTGNGYAKGAGKDRGHDRGKFGGRDRAKQPE